MWPWSKSEAWSSEGGRGEHVLEAVLRVGVAGCFIGHGAFGLLAKEAWLPYFAVLGIPEAWAWALMPVVGAVDITVGILALVSPRPAVFAYAAVWAVWTALLRPLAGESVFEVLERAGNYGIPVAFLVAAGFRARGAGLREWLAPIRIGRLTPERRRTLDVVLRATLALLLVGHGGLAVAGKPLLLEHTAAVGGGAGLLQAVGLGEIALGVVVAARPAPALLWSALAWKVGTELLYPMTGAPVWEVVERAGSYAAPLALLTLVAAGPLPAGRFMARAGAVGALAAVATGAVALPDRSADLVPAWGAWGTAPGPDASTHVAVALHPDTALLGRLRAGELVLACRHAITDGSRRDSQPVDYDDPSTQRVLSSEGEAQARTLGRTLRRLDVPVGEVLASPYARAMDSGRLGFGRVEASEGLVYGDRPAQRALRRRLLSEPTSGGNRVLMTHQGILYGLFPSIERGSIREGDCLVVLPQGDAGYEALARLGPEEFAALARDDPNPPAPDPLAAAREGGVVLVCRHAATGSFGEVEPVDYDDPSTQRLLSADGERQAAAIGSALRAAGVEVDELVASPMQRARRTAELMFPEMPVKIDSVWHTNGGSYGGPARDRRAEVLRTPAGPGVRLIVSHIGTMRSVLSDSLRIREGDCVVVRRGGGGALRELGVIPFHTSLTTPRLSPGRS
jgi:broad specificity phosphatase PhoE